LGILLTALSLLSGFHIRQPGNLMNFDIAAMLTPSGLIDNFVFGAHPILQPFYWRVSSRQGFGDHPLLWAVEGLIFAAALFLLKLLRTS
jgi:hypothetical protein